MRTTLTIEDQLAAELKELAHHSGKSFKQIVNEALDAGLQGLKHPKGRPYHLQPATMGPARPGPESTWTKPFKWPRRWKMRPSPTSSSSANDPRGRQLAALCSQSGSPTTPHRAHLAMKGWDFPGWFCWRFCETSWIKPEPAAT